METFIVILAVLGIVITLIAALPEPDEVDETIADFATFRDILNKKGE